MPAKMYLKDKKCVVCKRAFNRTLRPNGDLEAPTHYAARVYCSMSCCAYYRRVICPAPAIRQMDKLTSEQWAYLAGIFDGEGSVYLRRAYNRYGPRRTFSLSVTVVCGCHRNAIARINRMIGTKTLEKINGTGNKRTAWRIRLHGSQATRFLEGVQPFVLMKTRQIKIAIAFQKAKPSRGMHPLSETHVQFEQKCKDELTILNQRGVQHE